MEYNDQVITVALAWTPEAATAHFVCDGVDDQIEINAAIAAAGLAGGGIVRLGPGIYSTSGPVKVLASGVSLEGDSGGGTTILAAANWNSEPHPDGAGMTGVVTFVGVDGFAARDLTIQSAGKLMNGLIAIPAGTDGAGVFCTNGVFEGNAVEMEQGHTYSIWSLRSQGMQILNNTVDGGGTAATAHPAQEGIEIYGGRNVLISGNIVTGIGNVAINVGGLAGQTPDSTVENVTIVDNQVGNSRVGVFLGTTWGSQNGPQDMRHVLVENNSFDAMFEAGLLIRNWTGNATSPPALSDVTFRNNTVEMLFAESSGYSPAALWFFDATAPGETVRSDIVVEDNVFTTSVTDAVPTPLWLSPGHSPFAGFLFFSEVTFRGNYLDLTAASDMSKGIIAYYSEGIKISDNEIRGAGIYPIEFYDTSDFSISENNLSEWGRGTGYSGILVGLASDYNITGNEFVDATGGGNPHLLNIYQSAAAASLAANLRVTDQDATLVGSLIANLTLAAGAVSGTGNSSANVITGNAGANTLHGGGGVDVLIGQGGNDTYYTDVAATQVQEAVGDGNDKLYTSVSYTLAGSEVELLSANSYAAATPINLTGNGFAQTIIGNSGANTLHGGGGVDVLIGQGGNDTYYTDVSATKVQEAVGGGNDKLYTSVSYTLAGSEIELLSANSYAATTPINLTGNAFAQTIIGNDGANILHGGGGVDVLIGQGGNDTYYTDVAATQVQEAVGGGNDKLYTSVSYTLAGSEIELLSANSYVAATPINLTGNSFAQTIIGNDGANGLDGKGGSDTLIGFGGADTMRGGGGADQFVYFAAAESSATSRDTILDFGSGDRIDLSAIDAVQGGGNDGFSFIGSQAFTMTAGELRAELQSGHWLIQGDIDGNGAADLAMLVFRSDGESMIAADFLL